jgi:hypothetical protein
MLQLRAVDQDRLLVKQLLHAQFESKPAVKPSAAPETSTLISTSPIFVLSSSVVKEISAKSTSVPAGITTLSNAKAAASNPVIHSIDPNQPSFALGPFNQTIE